MSYVKTGMNRSIFFESQGLRGIITKKRLLWFLPWLAIAALLVWIYHSVSLADIVALLRQLSITQVLALAVMNTLVLLTRNGRWWLILRGLGHKLPYLSLTGYQLAAFGLSYFTPGPLVGGEPLQVYLVEKNHAVPRPTVIAAITVDKLLEWLVNVTFLVVGIAIILQQQAFDAVAASKIALFAVFLSSFPLAILAAIRQGKQPISSLLQLGHRLPFLQTRPAYQKICQTIQQSETLASDLCHHAPTTLISALLISVISWIIMVAEYWLMLSFLGLSLTFTQVIAGLAAARIALFLLVPGGLGTMEASQILALSNMGFNPAAGVSVSLLIRSRDVMLAVFGLWWAKRKVGALGKRN